MFARIGKTYSPISGKLVKKHTVSDVLDYIKTLDEGTRAYILAPIPSFDKYGIERQLEILKDQGYARLFYKGEVLDLDEIDPKLIKNGKIKDAKILIDRIKSVQQDEEALIRMADSVSLAFAEGNGNCDVYLTDSNINTHFNNRFELDGMEFVEPSEHFFTFNNPFGACRTCEGFGSVIGVDPNLVIPDTSLSVYQGAVAAWKGDSMGEYLKELIHSAPKFNFPIHRPIDDLTPAELDLLWSGNEYFTGITKFFKFLETQSYKIQYRVMLSRYRGKTGCPDCKGTRLRKDTNYVKIGGKTVTEIVLMPVEDAFVFFDKLKLPEGEINVSKRLLPEITNRLSFLEDVGLGYLTLNRQSNSLSGGESQRINLATSLGSSLVGSMYILDEPSIGLHPRDTERLIVVLKKLRDIGNTVIVVEHEEDIMQAADEIIDIGPMAGIFGGEVVFQGNHEQLIHSSNSLTAKYLTGQMEIKIPKKRKKSNQQIKIIGAKENNLKNVTVSFPLFNLVCVTGVSGSGKSTLVKDILYPAVRKHLNQFGDFQGNFQSIEGDLKMVKAIEFIDQNPIGKSSRSNPVTYVKAFDDIRELFARLPLSVSRGYRPGFFSFNVEGGRCEMCEGEGQTTVGMQFMADVHLLCEACEGSRYKQETLEIEFEGKNIADILNLDIQTALEFFKNSDNKLSDKIAAKIQPLFDVGLGYLKMGQSSSTLSGGEAQRVKLASFLSKGDNSPSTLFIFDEPTTGLHFYDIEKLLIAFQRLIDQGNSIIVIEHNADVIKCADWVIDLGPEGGNKGGNLVFEGTPEDMVKDKKSLTGQFLAKKFK